MMHDLIRTKKAGNSESHEAQKKTSFMLLTHVRITLSKRETLEESIQPKPREIGYYGR